MLKPREIAGSGGARVKRPTSAVGLKRPTSEYTRINKGLGQLNPRYKAENILQLDLDYAERTTEDFVPAADSERVQNAIASALQPEGEDEPPPPFLPFEDADAPKKARVKSAKRPGTAKRKKAPPPPDSEEPPTTASRKSLHSDKRKL